MQNGECVCGKVSYQITSKIDTLYQCHCTLCQKQTGTSSQTGLFVNSADFKWLSGLDAISVYTKETGYCYSFCSVCGSTVPNQFRSGERYWVPAGALVGLTSAKIRNHIFVADKAEWDDIGGSADQHEGFFPVYD